MKSRCVMGMIPFCLSVALMLLVGGCGGDGVEKFKGPFGQVTGKVTFEGKPIPEGSQVLFQSTEKGGYLATGIVNASGEYTLQCDGSPNLPGLTYQVTFMPPSKAAGPSTTDPAAGANVSLAAGVAPFPEKYSTPSKMLVSTVKEGKNTADFVLIK